MVKQRIYLGLKTRNRIAVRAMFRSATEPTQATHGRRFAAVVGPFKTVRGCKAMIHFGLNNPHMRHVNDAERIGKQYADDLKDKPKAITVRY